VSVPCAPPVRYGLLQNTWSRRTARTLGPVEALRTWSTQPLGLAELQAPGSGNLLLREDVAC